VQLIEVLPNSTFSPEGGEVIYRTSGGFIKREKLLKVEETDLKLPYKFLNPIQTLFYKFYKGGNALVSAPTSAGKTVVAFTFFKNREGRLVYTAPTKSLVSEKAKELKALYGSVDIRTGDVIEEFKPVRSKVVVSTYENLVLALRNGASWTRDLRAVVVDEIHAILGNRGQVVEEIITELLLRDVDILALSATIPGAQKLARWLGAKLFIKSQWRPVPLKREVLPLKEFKEWIPPKELGEIKGDERFALKLLSALFELARPEEKVLVFVPKKNIGWKMLEFANRERLEIANKTAPFEIEREGMEIAFHNADVPKEEREEIEKAFRKGQLNKLIATQTLAYGVNLPADKVVIAVKGFYDRQSRCYKFFPNLLDILQEEGRAGRFGIKDKGYSYILVYGSNLARLKEELETALEGEFKPFLAKEISPSSHRLGEEAFAKLTLFLLVAFLHKGKNYKEFLKRTFSLRELVDHPAVKDAVNWLIENGYADELYRPTSKGLFCLKSGLPPLNFEEFLKRKELPIPLIAKLRPLIYTKRLDGIFPFIKGRNRFKEDMDRVGEILLPCGESCFADNTDQLLFFVFGYTFYYPNISNPPGDFSYLGSDALHLLRTLLELRKIGEFTESNEILLKIAHCLKYGLTENFSPLGGIKGIGHVRANLLKEFLQTEGVNRLSFTQKVGDIFSEFSPNGLKENLAYLLMELRNLDERRALREANITLSLLKRNSNSLLVDGKILRTFGLFVFGRESLGWKREELLKKVLED